MTATEQADLIDAYAAARVSEAVQKAARIVEKWDAVSDRWDDMPMDNDTIRGRLLHNIRAITETP